MKAFLSHNFYDKDFVSAVFEELGAAKAVFDAATFEKNADLVAQIREGLQSCEIYVLFVSRGALKSGWVRAEIDLAAELKANASISKFLVFQLDDTNWSELPEWMRRYVTACPPSPQHVAARIKDEFKKNPLTHEGCYGRDVEVKTITSDILDRDVPPTFLFLSGPHGIGRRTVAKDVYRTLYDGISKHFIEITCEEYFDIVWLYRKLLNFSGNWHARAFSEASQKFVSLSPEDQLIAMGNLILEITIGFNQVLLLDLGTHAFDETDKTSTWLTSLMDVLPKSRMPYVVFVSNRAADGFDYTNGVFHSVDPLGEKDSEYLFKVLLQKYKIELPSREERDSIQKSIVGHPGLIATVVNYLRTNPKYKPNRTHNNVVALVRAEVEKMLRDFLRTDPNLKQVVSLFGEASIISYAEILMIDTVWPEFSSAVERLIDAGFLQNHDSYYQLSNYLRRYSQNLPDSDIEKISAARKVLFSANDPDSNDPYVAVDLLDARIVEYFLNGAEIPNYLSNLVMPVQQLKAAKRLYDKQQYDRALGLAREAYDQSQKLSGEGLLEAWRLIGLSAVREHDTEAFEFFLHEYNKIPSSKKRDGLFYFAQGFKARSEGDLRNALKHFKSVEKTGFEDAHVHREIAYIYSFDGKYDEAIEYSKRALKFSPLNSYVLDILVWALLRSYRENRDARLPAEIDLRLEQLQEADARDNTRFSFIRGQIRDIVIDHSTTALSMAFDERRPMPIPVKVSLLEMLSLKGKNSAYDSLSSEIERALRSARNPLADIEFARVRIMHFAYNGKKEEAASLLNRYRTKFTEYYESVLRKEIASH